MTDTRRCIELFVSLFLEGLLSARRTQGRKETERERRVEIERERLPTGGIGEGTGPADFLRSLPVQTINSSVITTELSNHV